MISDKDCYPSSEMPKDLVLISECWVEMSERDPPIYTCGTIDLPIFELKRASDQKWKQLCAKEGLKPSEAEVLARFLEIADDAELVPSKDWPKQADEKWRRLCQERGHPISSDELEERLIKPKDDMLLPPLDEWLRQTAEHKISIGIRDGSIHVYSNNDRRVLPRVFDENVYIDRSIKGGALRTISHDDREGAGLFVSRAQFDSWKKNISARTANVFAWSKLEEATERLVTLMKSSPKQPPDNMTCDEIRRRIAREIGIPLSHVKRAWEDAIAEVPDCRWSDKGRRKK